jgi:hypothetical protein
MSKAYNENGVETPEFRIHNQKPMDTLLKLVDQLMSLGYSGQDVSYFLGGVTQLRVSSNNITTAFARTREDDRNLVKERKVFERMVAAQSDASNEYTLGKLKSVDED